VRGRRLMATASKCMCSAWPCNIQWARQEDCSFPFPKRALVGPLQADLASASFLSGVISTFCLFYLVAAVRNQDDVALLLAPFASNLSEDSLRERGVAREEGRHAAYVAAATRLD